MAEGRNCKRTNGYNKKSTVVELIRQPIGIEDNHVQ